VPELIVGRKIMHMNARSDNPKFPFTVLLHGVGIALFVAGLYLVGLSLTDISASLLKIIGAAIFFFGCDDLVWSGWRSWIQWRVRRAAQAS
jgi:hypothetical protein